MPTPHDFISSAEFNRWIGEEANFRSRLEGRIEAMHTHVKAELAEIKGMVRETNGKTARNGEAIAVIERRLGAIESEDRAIESTVETIKTHGCAQLDRHLDAVETLGWSRRKKAAVAGGLFGGGALAWPALHELAKAIQAVLGTHP